MQVEGETEKIILPELSKRLTKSNGDSANFLKNNVSTVDMKGKTNITSYVKILDHFNIPWMAVLDDDFLDIRTQYSNLCDYLGIDKNAAKEDIRTQLGTRKIAVLRQGEIEDVIPDTDLKNMSGKNHTEIQAAKQRYQKTSKAFEKAIFEMTKPECAYKTVDYYMAQQSSPFDRLILWLLN